MTELKEVHNYFSRIVDGHEVEKALTSIEYQNDLGQITKEEIYVNNEVSQVEYTRYENNKVVEIIGEFTDSERDSKTTFKYDNDLLVEEKEYFSEKEFVLTTYKYDDKNRNVSIIQTTETNEGLSKVIKQYDEDEELIQYFDENEFIFRQEVISRNQNGQILKMVSSEFYLGKKNLESEEKFVQILDYDKFGNINSVQVFRDERLIIKESFEYNSKKQVIKELKWSHETELESIIIYKYDLSDQLIYEAKTENGKLILEKKFVYQNEELYQIDYKELSTWDYYVESRSTFVHV